MPVWVWGFLVCQCDRMMGSTLHHRVRSRLVDGSVTRAPQRQANRRHIPHVVRGRLTGPAAQSVAPWVGEQESGEPERHFSIDC